MVCKMMKKEFLKWIWKLHHFKILIVLCETSLEFTIFDNKKCLNGCMLFIDILMSYAFSELIWVCEIFLLFLLLFDYEYIA